MSFDKTKAKRVVELSQADRDYIRGLVSTGDPESAIQFGEFLAQRLGVGGEKPKLKQFTRTLIFEGDGSALERRLPARVECALYDDGSCGCNQDPPGVCFVPDVCPAYSGG